MKKHPSGFTLVELLTVVAILAVLAAIAFPFARGAIQKAAAAKCIGNLRAMGAAAHSYAAENNGRLPWRIQTADNNHRGEQWDAQIAPYLGVNFNTKSNFATVFVCPAAKRNSDVDILLSQNLSYGLNRRFQPAAGKPSPTVLTITNPQTLIILNPAVG